MDNDPRFEEHKRLPGGRQWQRDFKMGHYAHKMAKDPETGKNSESFLGIVSRPPLWLTVVDPGRLTSYFYHQSEWDYPP